MYIINIYSGDWFVKRLNLDLLWSIAFLSHCIVVFKWAHVGGIVVCMVCEAAAGPLPQRVWPTKIPVTFAQDTYPAGTLG